MQRIVDYGAQFLRQNMNNACTLQKGSSVLDVASEGVVEDEMSKPVCATQPSQIEGPLHEIPEGLYYIAICLCGRAVPIRTNVTTTAALFATAPALFVAAPTLFATAPALFVAAPTLFATAPALFATAPALFLAAPALFATAKKKFLGRHSQHVLLA